MQKHKIFVVFKSPSSAKIKAGFFMSVVFVFRLLFKKIAINIVLIYSFFRHFQKFFFVTSFFRVFIGSF